MLTAVSLVTRRAIGVIEQSLRERWDSESSRGGASLSVLLLLRAAVLALRLQASLEKLQ